MMFLKIVKQRILQVTINNLWPPSMPSNDQNGTSNQNSNQGQPPAMPGQNTNNTQTTNSNS